MRRRVLPVDHSGMEGDMARTGWGGGGWHGGFEDESLWDELLRDELLWDEWTDEDDLDDFGIWNRSILGEEAGESLTHTHLEEELADGFIGAESTGESWDWTAPVNVDAQGRIFRKTRFPIFLGGPSEVEWMWVQVTSMDDRSGILANHPIFVPGLTAGDPVRFEIIPEGRPRAGCAEAVGW
ncbi:MAG: hypothetical protein EA422_02270 [Gemmatimonadales bacterium]|nr:MAG: hypothetical protein EA422_02270 [Gemmatimonadales bacterium]